MHFFIEKMSANVSKNRSKFSAITWYLGVKSFLPLEHYKTGVLLSTWYFSKIQQLLSSAIPARSC